MTESTTGLFEKASLFESWCVLVPFQPTGMAMDDAVVLPLVRHWGNRDALRAEVFATQQREVDGAVEIVRGSLQLMQTSGLRFPGWGVHRLTLGELDAAAAMVLTVALNGHCKKDRRFYDLKGAMIWAAAKLGAVAGWMRDFDDMPVFLLQVEGWGWAGFHDTNDSWRVFLREYEHQAYPHLRLWRDRLDLPLAIGRLRQRGRE